MLGPAAARAVAELFAEHGMELRTGVLPIAVQNGRLTLAPEGEVKADRFVALPEQRGIEIEGVPHVPGGFIPVDEHGRVEDMTNVFAAGDITSYSVKQGGIAAQQADAVAEVIAARAGAAILPEPFRPVLRSVLLTGERPALPLKPAAREQRDLVRGDDPAVLVAARQDRRPVPGALPGPADRGRAAIARSGRPSTRRPLRTSGSGRARGAP